MGFFISAFKSFLLLSLLLSNHSSSFVEVQAERYVQGNRDYSGAAYRTTVETPTAGHYEAYPARRSYGGDSSSGYDPYYRAAALSGSAAAASWAPTADRAAPLYDNVNNVQAAYASSPTYEVPPSQYANNNKPASVVVSVSPIINNDHNKPIPSSAFEPLRFECPNGAEAREGMCVITVEATITCPTGFQKKENRCVQSKKEKPTYSCYIGKLEGDKCKIESPKPNVCPAEYQMDHRTGMCVKFGPPTQECPKDYKLTSNRCIKETQTDATASCPRGYEMATGKKECFRLVPRRPHCPEGFSMDYREQRCKKTTKKSRAACPAGFQATSETHCQRLHVAAPQVLCPDGLDLVDGACVVAVEAKKGICSDLYQMNLETLKCERPVGMVLQCPDGGSLYGGDKCRRHVEHEKYGECPAGYDLVGQSCKKVQVFPTQRHCPEGQLDRDVCTSQHAVAPRYACPTGFDLAMPAPDQGGTPSVTCARVTAYDCSLITTEQVCSMPDFVGSLGQGRGSTNSSSRRMLAGGSDYKKKKAVLNTVTLGVPIDDSMRQGKGAICRDVPRKISRTCTKQVVQAAELVCPALARPTHDRKCEVEATYAPLPYCREGSRLDKQTRCLRVTTAPAAWHCPAGQDVGGQKCVEHELTKAEYGCPKGALMRMDLHGNAVCYEEKEPTRPPPQIVKKLPTLVCRSGVLKGDDCIETEQVDRHLECPKGAFESEYDRYGCVLLADLVQPEPERLTVEPRYSCADFSIPNAAKKCEKTEYASPVPECKSEGKVKGVLIDSKGKKCAFEQPSVTQKPDVKTETANMSCRKGTLVDNTCSYDEVRELIVECPSGFEPETGRAPPSCAKYLVPKLIQRPPQKLNV